MAINYNDVSKLRQTELNWANVHNFYAVIERLPDIVFTCQRVQLGSLSAGEAQMSNRFNINRTLPGDSLDYGVCSIDFIVTQNFSNYRSVLEWLKGSVNPETTEQFVEYTRNFGEDDNKFSKLFSDMTIIATDAGDRPLCQWNMRNCFPTSLESPSFDSTVSDVSYLTSNVTFNYHYFEHQTYTNGTLNNNKI